VSELQGKVHLDAIDGLRGVAILMVVYQHTLATAVGNVVTGTFGFRFPFVVANGWMGVGLFFMLSGFVLALPYYSNVRTMETASDFRGYYQHRAMRLLPLFVFMAIISYLVGAARGFDQLGSLLLCLSTASMFTSNEFFPKINGSFWSLMVEIWFSVVFPFLLLAIRRYRLAVVVLPILVLAIVIRIVGAYVPFSDIHTNPVKDFFVARMDDFLAGILLAWAYAHNKLPLRHSSLMFVAGWMTIITTAFLWDLRMQGLVPLFAVAFFNNLSQVGFGLILVSVLQLGWSRDLVSIWGLRVLGAMCFSVYCWHGLLITPNLRLDPFNLVAQLQYWFALALLSSLTYRFIEFPNERSLAKLFRLAAKPNVRSES
jgi:peptidoglycan/LPS O-acetylase OafA/YrhL